MKIDFSQQLKNLNGAVLKDEANADVNLGSICTNALLVSYQDEGNLAGNEKVQRYDLALMIHASIVPLDLKVEDVALIKKLVAKFYGPLVVGQSFKMIEGE